MKNPNPELSPSSLPQYVIYDGNSFIADLGGYMGSIIFGFALAWLVVTLYETKVKLGMGRIVDL